MLYRRGKRGGTPGSKMTTAVQEVEEEVDSFVEGHFMPFIGAPSTPDNFDNKVFGIVSKEVPTLRIDGVVRKPPTFPQDIYTLLCQWTQSYENVLLGISRNSFLSIGR